MSESHLPDCLLSCRDAGAGLVISHIKLDNFLSLNLRILSVRTGGRQLVITGAMMVSRSSSGARAGVGGASVTSPMWMPRMSTSLTIYREIVNTTITPLAVSPVELDQRVPAAQD